MDDIQLHHKRDLRIFDNMSRKDTRASVAVNYIKTSIQEKETTKDISEPRNIIFINYLILFQIIDRIYKQDTSIISSPYYNDIYKYITYPYLNYNNLKSQFINTLTNVTCIRYSNIIQYELNYI